MPWQSASAGDDLCKRFLGRMTMIDNPSATGLAPYEIKMRIAQIDRMFMHPTGLTMSAFLRLFDERDELRKAAASTGDA